jgi:hypothetical protein
MNTLYGSELFAKYLISLVLRERIELSTSPLPRECSTTELPQLSPERISKFPSAGVCRIGPVLRQGGDPFESIRGIDGNSSQLNMTYTKSH